MSRFPGKKKKREKLVGGGCLNIHRGHKARGKGEERTCGF